MSEGGEGIPIQSNATDTQQDVLTNPKPINSSGQLSVLEPTSTQVEEAVKPQPWLDLEREAAYTRSGEIFKQMGDEGLREWFVGFFNKPIVEAGGQPLTIDDVESLVYQEVQSVSASEIAGQEVSRPVLVFWKGNEFGKFYSRYRPTAQAPGAAVLSGFTGGVLEKTGLILSRPHDHELAHEIRHTIDPNMQKRQGYDRILEEVFAYYYQTVGGEFNSDASWQSLEKLIGGESYRTTYDEESPSPVSREEYLELCRKVVVAAREMQARVGNIETQRSLAKSETIQDFLNPKISDPVQVV